MIIVVRANQECKCYRIQCILEAYSLLLISIVFDRIELFHIVQTYGPLEY